MTESKAYAFKCKVPTVFAVHGASTKLFRFFQVLETEEGDIARIVPWYPEIKAGVAEGWQAVPNHIETLSPKELYVDSLRGKELFWWSLNTTLAKELSANGETATYQIPLIELQRKNCYPRSAHGLELSHTHVAFGDDKVERLDNAHGLTAWSAWKNAKDRFLAKTLHYTHRLDTDSDGTTEEDDEDMESVDDDTASYVSDGDTAACVAMISLFVLLSMNLLFVLLAAGFVGNEPPIWSNLNLPANWDAIRSAIRLHDEL